MDIGYEVVNRYEYHHDLNTILSSQCHCQDTAWPKTGHRHETVVDAFAERGRMRCSFARLTWRLGGVVAVCLIAVPLT